MSDKAPAPKKAGGKSKLMLIVVALASIGGGASIPMVMAKGSTTEAGHGDEKKKKSGSEHAAINVPFGDVCVNLADERMSRYLRLKIILKVEGVTDEKIGVEHLATFKPVMKNWLISHLAGKSLKEISGTMGVKKIQREILEKFEEIMTAEQEAHGHSKVHMHLKEILFEEYVVQ
ncbi:flagellar basal body-associated FliL family protein [Zavarzinella formosa]|uniref:flagellar basal body-associated FliL family protein n=1 Tax=Zavarzinella formosa TaxID=360055 RepID=UPI0002F2E00F|nr:flagellar basal body-associated FliL family protein [Zavarzinella formosa]